jgi:hypothetical protein
VLDHVIKSISGFLFRIESRFGLAATSVIVTLILTGIAVIYVQPVFKTAFHGLLFRDLSLHPFSFQVENHLQYRILGPLLGYVLFLRGDLFFILPIVFIIMFPAAAYYIFRKKGIEPVDSFFMTCFIAMSCVILLPLVAPGYTDVITWFFIFLAFSNAKQTWKGAIFFALALLNHESSLVLLPGLILYSWRLQKSGFAKIIFIYLIACIPHLLYRQYVDAQVNTLYSVIYYLSENNFWFVMRKLVMYLPAAIFYAFKLWWIFPVCFVAWAIHQKKFLECCIIACITGGGFMLAFIGYDFTRMVVIAFPAVLISYEWFKEILEKERLRKLTVVIIVLNFFILQYQFNYDGAQPMFPWILNKISAMAGIPLV